jgi:hypothetical protein
MKSIIFCLLVTFACLQTEAANLPAPTLSAPANTATGVSTSPTYSWSAVSGVISPGYWLAVATSSATLPTDPAASTGPGCVIFETANSTLDTPSTVLNAGTTYYWRVRGRGPGSIYGNWSSIFSFTTQPGSTSSSPFSGKGDWMVNIDTCIQNTPLTTHTLQGLIDWEKSKGIQFIIVKAGQGDHYFPSSSTYTKLDSTFVQICHTAGIKVFGFHYVYGGAYDPFWDEDTSVSQEIVIAQQILATGCDGLVIDAELEYEDAQTSYRYRMYGGTLPSAATAAASYCQGILVAYPSAVLAHSPIWKPSSHPTFPYITFGKYCAAVMPQAYCSAYATPSQTWLNPVAPSQMIQLLDADWTTTQNNWISQGHADSVKPIIPVAYAASPVTGQEITDFVNVLKNDTTPATSGGYQGVSFYDCDLHTASIWNTIASATIGSTSPPPPTDTTAPTISAFNVSSSSATLGQALTISYTLSDSGGSHLNQATLWRANIDGTLNDSSWVQIGNAISLSGDGPSIGSFPTDTPPAIGNYWYGIHVTDGANNYMNERLAGLGPIEVTVTQPDTTPPTVAISSPASGMTYTTAQTVVIMASASDNVGVTKVDFYDGTSLIDSVPTAPYAHGWAITSANNGTHNWTARAYDAAGNVTTSSGVSLTVNIAVPDTTPPSLTIGSPANGANVTSASLPVSGTASDSGLGNNGISLVTVNGIAANNDTVSGSGTANWNATVSLHSGPNIITVIATDGVGNATSPQQSTVTYNPPRPIFGGSSVSSGQLQTALSGLSVGETVVLEVSTDLKTWTPVQTKVASGTTLTFTSTVNSAMKFQYFRVMAQ